jgi:hypothetical protein
MSILKVKCEFDTTNTQKSFNHLDCFFNLKFELGEDLLSTILESTEFEELCEANRETFRLVDLAKEDKVKASDVDKANYKRYLKKIALQKKFFNTDVKETKTGYEKYE